MSTESSEMSDPFTFHEFVFPLHEWLSVLLTKKVLECITSMSKRIHRSHSQVRSICEIADLRDSW